ncbi:MAG TPA: helix-turn-helix domain-containing protein [Steroidobacteraceae bacterium]|nr:helix-turn-helix domain-containing protein [Steroidobacteraceae bacterium]
MESTRPIRALTRGLDALTVLNSRDGATVSEVAQEIRLPRTTVYRILETLCNTGFVFRDAADDRYRLTVEVRRLSRGIDDESWVSQIAKPHIDALGQDIVWPVSIATVSGSAMMVRESTDHETPLAIERYSAGFRLPLLASAAGRVYLAHCPADERDALIDIRARSNREEDKPARMPRAELHRMLADIKREGYATSTKTRRLVDEVSLSVPVNSYERIFASLTVRFITSAVPLKTALERFLPKLRQCSAVINTLYSDQQSAAPATGAPETAA